MKKNVNLKIVIIFFVLGIIIILGFGASNIFMLNQMENIGTNQENAELMQTITEQISQTKLIIIIAMVVYTIISILIGYFVLKAVVSPMKKLILELGGKDAAIVLDDIDVLEVAKEIVKGAYGYSGQRCTAIKRIIVLNEIADRLVIALREEILKLRIGNPFSNPDIVPMIDKKSLDYVLSLIQDALFHGGNIVTGNQIVGHNLLTPTLVDNVSLKSRLAWEEPFGPVVPIIRVKDISEAISVANASNFGLQGSVFTNDKAKALLIANHLNTGTVNINKSSSRGPDIFPFIGVKDSGFGVQGIEGAMVEMTRIKGIVENS